MIWRERGMVRLVNRIVAVSVVLVWGAVAAMATPGREKLEDFLNVTGFDAALESIQLSAASAPMMLGLNSDDFGSQWTSVTKEVFDTDYMNDLALDMLDKTMSEDLIDHANDFYASELGRRLVVAENASHLKEDDESKSEAGEAILSGLVQIGSPRVKDLRRMTEASDVDGASLRAIQEIQVRFLMAAAGAGVIDLSLDEADLREQLSRQENRLRASILVSAMEGAAYTYQAFSDAEVAQYADALEHPTMQEVYGLMNAIQYEIMANRFEALAAAMSALNPSTDL